MPKKSKPRLRTRAKSVKISAPRFRKVKTDKRLSARHYYENTGKVGDSCIVSGKLKKLLIRKNGSPYWQTCTPNVVKNYGKCKLNCKDSAGKNY